MNEIQKTLTPSPLSFVFTLALHNEEGSERKEEEEERERGSERSKATNPIIAFTLTLKPSRPERCEAGVKATYAGRGYLARSSSYCFQWPFHHTSVHVL